MKAFLRLITLASALALCLVFPSFAAETEGLGPNKWPITVQDTVKDILSRMSEKDKELVRNTKGGDLIMFHHGWGTGIRNYYGLWRSNQKLIESACGMPCQPDDASMIIRQYDKSYKNDGYPMFHRTQLKFNQAGRVLACFIIWPTATF
jgi:hypothetical protein